MRGFGRVYRRGRIWWIAYSVCGAERRESSGSTAKEDAKDILKDRIGERHRLTERSAPRLSAVIDDYIADLELRHSRPTTIRYIRKCYRGAGERAAKRIEYFTRLWDSLNAKRGYGWDANPFCWVVAFRRHTGSTTNAA